MHLVYFLRKMMQRLCRNGRRAVFISCWVCERKHRIPKRWVNHHVNTSTRFDRSAFRDVTAFTLAQLKHHEGLRQVGLGDWVHPTLSVKDADPLRSVLLETFGDRIFMKSKVAQVSVHESVHVGDVVEGVCGEQRFVGRVECLFSVDKKCCSILTAWRCSNRDEHASTWDTSAPAKLLVRIEDIMSACVFFERGGTAVVLANPRARGR